MKNVFERFCRGLTEVENHISNNGHGFMWNEHLGYVLTCPSNLGTGLRAGKSLLFFSCRLIIILAIGFLFNMFNFPLKIIVAE